MDALEAIFSRRSIRKYTEDKVPQEAVEKVLAAAMVAPSAADQRPWHFVVVEDCDLIRSLQSRMEHCDMLAEATLALVVCGDERLEKIPGFWVQDCSACSENILLAAHAIGLGAVWVAAYPLEDRMRAIRETLGVPQEVIPFSVISLGYPAERLAGENRYDPARVHRDHWRDRA